MGLLKACADGDLNQIKSIVRSGKAKKYTVRIKDNHNWTCLHHAVKSGNIECVKYLLTIKELDTTAETFEGETALQLACSIPNVSLEMVATLIEANCDLLNYVNNEEVDVVQCSVIQNRLDIVQLLINKGASVNSQDLDGDTCLHLAAIKLQIDIVRYLIYETNCDPNTRNEYGKTACFMFFVNLIKRTTSPSGDLHLTVDELKCFDELAQFTYDLDKPMNSELKEMLHMITDFCFRFNHLTLRSLYLQIVEMLSLSPSNSKQYFVKKLLDANLPSDYCLIFLMHAMNEGNRSFDVISNLIAELFMLFMVDESFFYEYMSELMSTGLIFNEIEQTNEFCQLLTTERFAELSIQKLFDFVKVLILYEIKFVSFLILCRQWLRKYYLCNVFVPLSIFVNAPLELYWTVEFRDKQNYNNFNESGDVISDFDKLVTNSAKCEVVSLKNLSRMSVRRYYVTKYSHYEALKKLYSLNIPVQLRNFLCYNFCNLKF